MSSTGRPAANGPLVSVVTPVYNGAAYLQDCIDSVLGQTYENFEYVIADNCSTDATVEIAERAAERDDRVRVIRCSEHLGIIPNWNRSLSYVSPEAGYIKFAHADDWLFPPCLEKMVAVAESDHAIGLVSAYRLEEDRVSLDKLPARAPLTPAGESFRMDGAEVARAVLEEKASVLGSPTSVLIAARAWDRSEPLYSEEFLHTDKEFALRLFRNHDFGFVRQVLTFTRRHNESMTSRTHRLDTRRQENLIFLKRYGSEFLPDDALEQTLGRELSGYYRFLASHVGGGSGREFWDSHKRVLERAGHPYRRSALARAAVRQWLNPYSALRNLRRTRRESNAEGRAPGNARNSSAGADSGAGQ